MLFSSSKIGHIGQILTSGILCEAGTSYLNLPTAGEIETFFHVVVQVVVGLVTIYATVRKLFQKPENVVKLPAVGAVVAPVPPVTTTPADTVTVEVADGAR